MCLINFTGSKGGGAQYTYELTEALVEKNIPVVAVISSENEDLQKWKKLPLVKLVVIDTYKTAIELVKNSIVWRSQKQQIVDELAPYRVTRIIVPMITFWTKRINSLYPEAKMIVVLHDPVAHSGDKNKRALQVFGETAILKSADTIVVLSQIFKEMVEENYNKKDQVVQIPMGTTNLYSNMEDKVVTPNYDAEKVNFLFFGTISKYKGIEVLAKAFRRVRESLPNVTLTVAGSGDFSLYEASFEGIPDVTIYNRWIMNEEVESFFKDESTVVVLPYLDATQSGVIPLSIEYGVPIIASNAGGIVEQLEQYQTGIMFDVNDDEQLAKVMIDMASKPELLQEHKTSALANREKFSWPRIADEFIELMN